MSENENRPGLSRRSALTGAALASTAAACASASPEAPAFQGAIRLTQDQSTPHALPTDERAQGKPNVVVIVLDDVGFADFGCFGSEIETPAIDALASGGLRFKNFHTNGVCSATRASLLTGLNPHSAGIGWLTYEDSGFPGYRGDLAQNAVTIAEAFQENGYRTYHSGKWHVNIGRSVNSAGPFENWPLQRGFARSYWFQGHSIDFFRPTNLFSGNERVSAPEDFYATDAFTSKAIGFLTDHLAQAPDAPFFLYLAHPAAHSPLQAPDADIRAQRGRYDQGWDEARRARFAKQRALGLFGENVALPGRNPGETAWADLNDDERRLYARYMEIYAAMLTRIDQSVDQVVRFLRDANALENTIIVLMSDNGGSPDGGARGTPNMLAGRSGGVSLSETMNVFDDIGGANSYAMYPTGWASVSNTPFRLYKHDTHLGGVADPLIVHWPRGIADPGSMRNHYMHVSDIFPTLAECVGVSIPTTRDGHAARPVQGRSFRRAIDDASTPQIRREQHFELSGSRAFYADGWRLVSTSRLGDAADRWELFNVAVDPNETRDLAAEHPEIVSRLEDQWLRAAREFDVLPVDTRPQREKSFADYYRGDARSRWTLFPPTDLIQPEAAPSLFGRTHIINITIAPYAAGQRGALFTYGNLFLGMTLYVEGGALHYEYVSWPNRRHHMQVPLPSGAQHIRLAHTLSARPWAGVSQLSVDGRQAAELRSNHWPFGRTFQGLQIGTSDGAPVSSAEPPAFSGRILRADIQVDNSPYSAAEIALSNTPPRP